jgi:subtilisin family serine protease
VVAGRSRRGGVDASGPGVPVTVVDSGVDLTHPEFAHRSNSSPLNVQSLADTPEDFHGTAVASVAAAPANGAGIVGVYPTAALRAWDARRLSNADVIAGILAAAKRGPTVINLSLGYPQPDPMIEQAVLVAFGEGSIVVAAAGNDFQNGNPLVYPASLPHVLTVAATDEGNRPTSFSSASEAVDLAAPGQDIVAAVPFSFDPNGWRSVDGTSFSAPIVSAATAWVWSAQPQLDNTQVFDLLRWSARDVWRNGFDPDTGFGLLDLPAALATTPPPLDPQEPNDDVYEIKAHGLFREPTAPLTHGAHGTARVAARVDVTEDPVDVYRVWVPARKTANVKLLGTDDVDLAVWKQSTTSVDETGSAERRDLIGSSSASGTAPDTFAVRNARRRGEFVYVEVRLGAEIAAASYTLSLSTSRSRR